MTSFFRIPQDFRLEKYPVFVTLLNLSDPHRGIDGVHSCPWAPPLASAKRDFVFGQAGDDLALILIVEDFF